MINCFWSKSAAVLTIATLLLNQTRAVYAQDQVAAGDEKVTSEKAAEVKGKTDPAAQEQEGPTLTIGSKAPALDVEHWISDGNGKFKPVQEFEADKVYVVEFWATWCGPCIASMPHLVEVQNKFAAKGVQIISVSDEDLETVEGFLKRPVRGARKPAKAEAAEDGDNEKAKGEQSAEVSYGDLTSAYCLTTDPDGSVKHDYMAAAGQNGIPTSFIVGKSGEIEWIGHPMSMDKPLAEVVSGDWDRKAFLDEFRKEQERSLLMAKLNKKMQKGDIEGALEILAAAKEAAAGDEVAIAGFSNLEFRVKLSGAGRKIQSGEVEEGLSDLNALAESGSPPERNQVLMVKTSILLKEEMYDEVVKSVEALTNSKTPDSALLNQVSWQIYEAASENDEIAKPVVAAALGAAEKAVEGDPENGMILDTLAHLLHLQGELDRAIEVQTKAIENAGEASEDSTKEMSLFLKKMLKEKSEK